MFLRWLSFYCLYMVLYVVKKHDSCHIAFLNHIEHHAL